MNFIRTTVLSLIISAATAQTYAYDVTNPLEFKTWQEAQVEKLRQLNGGADVFNLDAGVVKFIRTHAEEIGKELEYLTDHRNPQLIALGQYEFEKFFTSLTQLLATKPFAEAQTLAQLLAKKEVSMFALDVAAYLKAMKNLTGQNIDPVHCPILAQGLQQLSIIEEIAFEFITLHQQQAATVPVPALDAETMEKITQVLPIAKKIATSAQAYTQTDDYAQRNKEMIRAWVAFMKEDAFFETIQHNADTYRTGNELKPLQLPETLQKLAIAFGALQEGFAEAMKSELTELQKFEFGTTHYNMDFDLDEGDAECSHCDMFDDACDIDSCCVEYDFNEQFNKKR